MPEGARLLSGKLERLPRALGQARELIGRKDGSRGLQSVLALDRKLDLDQKRIRIVALVERLADLAAWAGDPIAVGLNPRSHRVVHPYNRLIRDPLGQAMTSTAGSTSE